MIPYVREDEDAEIQLGLSTPMAMGGNIDRSPSAVFVLETGTGRTNQPSQHRNLSTTTANMNTHTNTNTEAMLFQQSEA